MTFFLLLIFDWWFGHRVLTGHPVIMAACVAAGLVEFHFKGWIMFAALMRLRDALPALSPQQVTLGKILLGIGYAWDMGLNVLACVWLLQLPVGRTATGWRVFWLLSPRLEYNVFSGRVDGWRKRRSDTFRRLYLDNVDSRGIHRG